MNKLTFTKYQGTGNDFIMIDNRDQSFKKHDNKIISHLCNRKFGIGSDGLILIENHSNLDFEMIFFNPDGSKSFCGNGSRCAVSFANEIGIIDGNAKFLAIDGVHDSVISNQNVTVKMADTGLPEDCLNGQFLDTGSPHYVEFISDIRNFAVLMNGKIIRHKNEIFGMGGTNVNFIEEISRGSVFVRTFERGVENETLSCGTGVTATAIIYGLANGVNKIEVETLGGKLKVEFNKDIEQGVKDIYLSGPVEKVFEGTVAIPVDLASRNI
jgi:diaminopimelate epimerase